MSDQLPMFDFEDEAPPTPGGTTPPKRYAIPDGTPVAHCRSCGAAMYWVATSAGAHMPLSAALVELDADGRRFALPHWIDCPSRDQHRRPHR